MFSFAMTSTEDTDYSEFIGAISYEEAERRRAQARSEAEQRAIQDERDILDGKRGDNGSIPLSAGVAVQSPDAAKSGSRPTLLTRIRHGGRARTIALANLLAAIVEPVVVLVLWCIPLQWSRTMLKTDDESGQSQRYVALVLRRKALSFMDFFLSTGMAMLAVILAVFLVRDAYINQRHSLVGRAVATVGLTSRSTSVVASLPSRQPRMFSALNLSPIATPGEINFIESRHIRPVSLEELSTGVLRDIEMFTETADALNIKEVRARIRSLGLPSAEHVGVPLRILQPLGNGATHGVVEWLVKLSDCSDSLVNPAVYDEAIAKHDVVLPPDNWLGQRTVAQVPKWIVVEHDVEGAVGLKEMCTLRNNDAAYFVEARMRWN